MKKITTTSIVSIICFAIMAYLSANSFAQNTTSGSILKAEGKQNVLPKKAAIFGTLNAGYSNLGLLGKMNLSYSKANRFLTVGYSKSHICFLDIAKGEFSPDSRASENHTTVQTLSVMTGIITHRVLHLSCGVAYSHFFYEHALPMTDILSFKSVWQTVLGKNYGETILSTHAVNAIGIPIEANLNFSPSRFAGFSTGVRVYVNTEHTIVSAELGIRLGRIMRKTLTNN